MINQEENGPVGFILINKPKGANSFRTIAQIRRILEQRKLKAGYAGTLDPFATGLLIVGIGREATRELHTITRWDKRYIARAKLGEQTDTLDCTGQVIEMCNAQDITEEKLFSAIKRIGNNYQQTPPLYSALKHEGVPLYKHARKKGKTAQDLQDVLSAKSRSVTLHEVTLIDFTWPFFTIEAHVSHGTYIRTLVNDIARNAGSCATTQELKRTAVGNVGLENATDLDALKTPDDILSRLIDVNVFVSRYF